MNRKERISIYVRMAALVLIALIAITTGLLLAGCNPTSPEPLAPTADLRATQVVQAEATQASFHTMLVQNASLDTSTAGYDFMADSGSLHPCASPPAIYDMYGTQQSVDWLNGRYGPKLTWLCTDPHPDANYVFRLVSLRESCGPALFLVNVQGRAGEAVIRYWPGADPLPSYDPPASRYTDQGLVCFTNDSGDCGFGVGHGDAYFPETSQGVTEFYIADYDGPSDWLGGVGWLDGTEHCTMFSFWQRIPAEDPATPIPPPTITPGPGTPTVTPEPSTGGWDIHLTIDGSITPRE